MQFDEMGLESRKTLLLLPGTACDYQTNFDSVLDELGAKYRLICVNYDGFDSSGLTFPDMATVTGKIEQYVQNNHGGRVDGAIGSSLGSSFVGQLVQRGNVHIDHAIFGSPDLDQSGRLSAWLQSKLVVPLLTGFTRSEKIRAKTREKLKGFFEMDDTRSSTPNWASRSTRSRNRKWLPSADDSRTASPSTLRRCAATSRASCPSAYTTCWRNP